MPARRDDAPRVDHPRAADAAGRGDLGEAVERHLAVRPRLDAVGLLAVRRRQAVEEAHHAVDPRAGADAGEQRRLRQGADELVQAPVAHLLAGAEPARDQEGVHGGVVGEAVVRQHREAGLRLDRSGRVGDQEGVELGVEAPRHGEHAVGRGEVDDLGVLEDVDPEPEPGDALAHRSSRGAWWSRMRAAAARARAAGAGSRSMSAETMAPSISRRRAAAAAAGRRRPADRRISSR